MKELILKITQPINLQIPFANILIAIPRMICGFFLTRNFGGSKFSLPWSPIGSDAAAIPWFHVIDWFPADVAAFGGIFAMAPVFFAWIASATEAIGGLFWILGLQVRLTSFLIAITMLVAVFYQQWENGLWGMLPAMGILWVSLYCLILGSGKFGLDTWLHKKLSTK